MHEQASRAFADLTGREWRVSEVHTFEFPLGSGVLFTSGEERIVLHGRPRRWPESSDEELRAALTLAHVRLAIASVEA